MIQPSADRIVRPTVSRHESARLRETLATTTSTELRVPELRDVVDGNLWMLTPDAFLYFLPAFLCSSLESYATVSIFASELLSALTEPSEQDVPEALDRIEHPPSGVGLPPELLKPLREQLMEHSDSSIAAIIFHERFDDVAPAEGSASLAFLVAFRKAQGANFPFDEIETAIDRHWGRYQPAAALP